MAAKFERNPEWMPDFLGSDEVREMLSEKGDEVRAAALAYAAPHIRTGEFEESITKQDGTYHTGRAYSRVQSDDPAVLSIEFGTKHSEAVRALGRAIRSI
jgi:hypothetical protein